MPIGLNRVQHDRGGGVGASGGGRDPRRSGPCSYGLLRVVKIDQLFGVFEK